jgi:hypothetical protein
MENTSLHTQKVAILSRLIKETSLTLEEALLLLKEDEVEETIVSAPSYIPGTTTPWTSPYYGSGTLPLTGTITTNANTSTYNFGNGGSNTTTTATITPSTPTADLNN